MATVKIFLEPGETLQEAQESLVKAFAAQENGEIHSEETFHQPAALHVYELLKYKHAEIWENILREINKVIDEEVT